MISIRQTSRILIRILAHLRGHRVHGVRFPVERYKELKMLVIILR